MYITNISEQWYTIDGRQHEFNGNSVDFCNEIQEALGNIKSSLEVQLYEYLLEKRVFPKTHGDKKPEVLAVLDQGLSNHIVLCEKAIDAISIQFKPEHGIEFKSIKQLVALHTELYNTSQALIEILIKE